MKNIAKWISLILVILLATIISILVLNHQFKSSDDKLGNIIDGEKVECYDCLNLERYEEFISYEDITASWKENQVKRNNIDEKVKKLHQEELARLVEVARVVEAERVEKARIAELERIEKARLAKLAEEEAERNRIAKLEAERVKRREEKKEQPVIASRSSGYQSNYETTFFTAQCSGCSGISASGIDLRNTIHYQGLRIVAAPRNIAMHTKLRITFANGSKMDAIVLDRGGDIGQGRLDILVSSKAEARQLGRQQVKVEIIN